MSESSGNLPPDKLDEEFHGFGPDETIQGRLIIETGDISGEEVFVSIHREKRRGRPRGHKVYTRKIYYNGSKY